MPNPNIEGKESKDRKCPILGGGEISSAYIELAKRRQSQYAKQIEFCVADATDRKSILEQQFTAFKPLAHRPKPMLAKP